MEAGADAASLTRVLEEVFGHYLDQQLNGAKDTPGDEGELFADIISGNGQGIGSAAPGDNDHTTFTIDGQSVEVELASYTFINAYEVTTELGHLADKESNSLDFHSKQGATGSGLGQVIVEDNNPSSRLFSGNDVSATGINVGGSTYYGWISRPIKSGGVVRGFYFWTDVDFTSLAIAQADGNQDGDANPFDNRGFLLVVDQAWFDAQNDVRGDIKNVGSSSDRVDTALNALVLANSAPQAYADSTTIAAGGSASGNVLTNDSDPDGDSLTVTRFVVDGQSYAVGSTAVIAGVGSLDIAPDGAYTFIPLSDYNGSVPTINYVVADTEGASATSTLNITVTAVNHPPQGGELPDGSLDPNYDPTTKQYAVTTPEDTPIPGQVSAYDRDGDSLSYTKSSGPTNGSVTVNPDGSYTYTPNANYSGNDSFTVSVSDGHGGNTTITVQVTVTPVNDPPTPVPDTGAAVEASGDLNATGTPATGNVLSNDTDPEHDPLTVDMVGTGLADRSVAAGTTSATGTTVVGLYGSLTLGADGTYRYQVDDANAAVQALRISGQTLDDSFSYRIGDGHGGYSTTTLTITIDGRNDNPVAADDYNVAKEHLSVGDTGFNATGNVLSNDTDVDGRSSYGETASIGSLDGSAQGTAVSTTQLNFSSPPANVKGGYYVYFKGSPLRDASGVQIQVDASYVSGGNVPLSGTIDASKSGVTDLNHDGKVDVNDLLGQSVDFYLKANGTGSNGSATLTTVTSTSTTVSISGPSGTIAVGMSVSGLDVLPGTTVSGISYDGSGNISSISLSQPASFSGTETLNFTAPAGTVLTGQYGTLSLSGDGSYTYKATQDQALQEGQSAVETFQYTMQDASGVPKSATLYITVLGSSGTDPMAVDDVGSVTEDVTPSTTGNVLGNGNDNDNYDLGAGMVASVSSAAASVSTADAGGDFQVKGLYGTLTLNQDGSYSYALDPGNAAVNALHDGETLSEDFHYLLNDPSGGSYLGVDAATLTITIYGVNDLPVGGELPDGSPDPNYDPTNKQYAVTTPEDTPISAQVKAYDPDDATLSYAQASDPTNGSVTVKSDGTYTYTPNPNYKGNDSFTVSVSDGHGGNTTITVQITVTPVNDAPVLDLDGNDSSGVSAADYRTSYALGGASAVPIADGDDSVTDVDSPTLASASIVLTKAKAGDVLTVGDLSSRNITASSTSLTAGADGSLSLTLTGKGSATPADFAAALQAITFSTSSDSTVSRNLDVTVNDGSADSNLAHTIIAVTPDSRALTVSGQTVNEASPYAVFKVSGAPSQQITLALGSTSYPSGNAVLGLDTGNAGSGVPLQVLDATNNWVDYTPGSTVTLNGSSLLVRTAIVQDTSYEGHETYTLVATNSAGTAYAGEGGIVDDGTGALFFGDNTSTTPNDPKAPGDSAYGTVLDDDRPLSVDTIEVNEGSPYAVFTVTGTAGQPVQLSLADGTATGADYGPGLEYWNGSDWQSYTPGSDVTIPVSGNTLLVRTPITNDTVYEGSEYFSLTARNGGGGAATGYGFINDDGTGTKYDGNVSVGTPATDTTGLDDDRALAISGGGTVNEASPYAMFTVTGLAGNAITLNLGLTADPSDRDADISGFHLEYSTDGVAWEPYTWNGTAGHMPTMPASGSVYVRVDISSESDSVFEGAENFTLTAAYESNPAKTATGTATIVDDGTGTKYDGSVSGASPVTDTTGLDDDRSVAVDSITVNEASPYAVFTVTGTAGQNVSLTLANGSATSADYGPSLEYWDGTAWQSYTPGNSVAMLAGGTLLVRTSITNDTIYEGAETFTLTATGSSGAATGTATIVDDGTGTKYDGSVSGASPVTDTTGLDDDRSVAVDSITVNEASPYAVFTVTGTAGQNVSLALADGTATGADYGPSLEYWDGAAWQSYTGPVAMPAGGTLLVRTSITNDTIYEGAETFTLTATGSSGAATGTATIVDDGTGIKYDGSVSSGSPGTTTTGLDDDRSVAVDSITVNEASPYAVFTVTGTAGQNVSLTLANGSATGADYGPSLEYWDGATWQSYTGPVAMPAGGTLLVRTTITNDTIYEGAETFTLTATGSSGAATGTATIVDDGTGTKYDGSVSGASPVTDTTGLDDDRRVPTSTPATISGLDTAIVVEDSGDYLKSGQLSVVDPDPGEAAFVPQSGVAGRYGSFSIDAAGRWRYVADDTLLQPLNRAGEASEQFVVHSIDGSTHTITITLDGQPESVPQILPNQYPTLAPIEFSTGAASQTMVPELYVLPEVAAVRASQEPGISATPLSPALAATLGLETDPALYVLPAVYEVQRDLSYVAHLIQRVAGNPFETDTLSGRLQGDRSFDLSPDLSEEEQAVVAKGHAPAAQPQDQAEGQREAGKEAGSTAAPRTGGAQPGEAPAPRPGAAAHADTRAYAGAFAQQLRQAAERHGTRHAADRVQGTATGKRPS